MAASTSWQNGRFLGPLDLLERPWIYQKAVAPDGTVYFLLGGPWICWKGLGFTESSGALDLLERPLIYQKAVAPDGIVAYFVLGILGFVRKALDLLENSGA